MIKNELTILDHLRETGFSGQLSVAVFLVGIAFAGWIHFRQLSFRHRVAFFTFSLLPLMIGVFGLAFETIEIIHEIPKPAVRPDGYWILSYFGEILQVIPLTAMETIILLVISIVLFLGRNSQSNEMHSEQGIAPNDR